MDPWLITAIITGAATILAAVIGVAFRKKKSNGKDVKQVVKGNKNVVIGVIEKHQEDKQHE